MGGDWKIKDSLAGHALLGQLRQRFGKRVVGNGNWNIMATDLRLLAVDF